MSNELERHEIPWMLLFILCVPLSLMLGGFVGMLFSWKRATLWEHRIKQIQLQHAKVEEQLQGEAVASEQRKNALRQRMLQLEGRQKAEAKSYQAALAGAKKKLRGVETKRDQLQRDLDLVLSELAETSKLPAKDHMPPKIPTEVAIDPTFKKAIVRDRLGRITYPEIRRNEELLTDAQWTIYGKQIIGSRVKWTGWVSNVDKEFLGKDYLLFVDMDSPDELFSVHDVVINLPKSKALSFHKGRKITFWATICDVGSLLGKRTIWLENAKIQ